ncbi:hypothetical protein BDM02DRAFT_3193124 [Thelephora ganbajun]|uniref:Uncharacterized protein n=1 Tax=Thelephora ganbajun TaxID=370292 RepID=A0ACB6YYM1_THEGA|nr:hypothetical protein BDM02DRAFT_3193124 [Thelephora ganbajun]
MGLLVQEGWEMPCRVFHLYGSFNDQVWQQAISSLRNIDKNCRKRPMYDNESILFELIQRGVVDLSPNDDIAIGSIVQYMAVVGECLWSLLECQQAMINQLERHFYKAMSDNCVLSEKVIRLEAQLDKMKNSDYSPGDGLDSQSPSAFECFNLLVGSLLESLGVTHDSPLLSNRVDLNHVCRCGERSVIKVEETNSPLGSGQVTAPKLSILEQAIIPLSCVFDPFLAFLLCV